jgi:threonine dehydratase
MSTAPQVESTTYQPPSWEDILAAHARIAPRIHRTPVLTSRSLDAIAGARLFFKCDNLQKTGSFKIRGASNAILSLSEAETTAQRWPARPHGAAFPRGSSCQRIRPP